MDQKVSLDTLLGVQKFVIVGSKSAQDSSTELALTKPRIVVNYLGKNLESYSFDESAFRFPF